MTFLTDIEVTPFDKEIRARRGEEVIAEEVYQSIPALNAIATATMAISTKLSLEARTALFFPPAGADESLRQLSVELALKRRDDMENASPDLAYMAAQKPATRQEYESAENDLWMPQPAGPTTKA